jgi:hypothetical protein
MNVENFEMLTCPPSGIRISIHSNKNEDVFRLSLGKQNSQPEGEEMDLLTFQSSRVPDNVSQNKTKTLDDFARAH